MKDSKKTNKYNISSQKKSTKELSNPLSLNFIILLILILIIPNIFYSEAMDQQLEVKLFSLSFILSLLFLLFLINKNAIKVKDISIIKNPLILIYALLIIIIGISIFLSANKSEAFYEFLKRVTFFLLFIYLLLFIIPKENSRIYTIKAFIIFSIIISITGLFQIFNVLSTSKFNLESIYLITGNFAQKNIFSEVLLFTFAFCIYGISILKKSWKIAAVIGAILNIILILFLMTRAIWLGIIVSLFLTIIIYIVFAKKNNIIQTIKPFLKYIIVIISIGVIAFAFILVKDKNKTIQHQISSATNFREGNSFHRINLWKKTLSLSKENLLLGVGAGNWRLNILKYDLQVFTDKGRVMPDRAHNDFLQILAENGIFGLISFAFIFLLSIYYCIKITRNSDNFNDIFFILVLLFILIGYMVDSCFSFPRERIELQIFLNCIFAFIVFEYNKSIKKESKKTSRSLQNILIPAAIISISLLSLTSYAAYKRIVSEVGVKQIYKYARTNNQEKILKITNDIYSNFSTITPFGDPIMEIKARALYQTKSEMNLVIDAFENSLKDSPYHLTTLNDLANLYMNNKNYDKALDYCNIALKYSPNDTKTNIIKSSIFLNMNNVDAAYDLLRSTKTNDFNDDTQRYKDNVNYILYSKLNKLVSITKNEEFNITLKTNVDKPDFLYNIFIYSLQRNETFEKTLLNVILSLCNQNKLINDASIEQLKKTYLQNNK